MGAIHEHKEQCYARREQRNESLKALLGGLEQDLVGNWPLLATSPRIGRSVMPRKSPASGPC
jgi:hypothetical protein